MNQGCFSCLCIFPVWWEASHLKQIFKSNHSFHVPYFEVSVLRTSIWFAEMQSFCKNRWNQCITYILSSLWKKILLGVVKFIGDTWYEYFHTSNFPLYKVEVIKIHHLQNGLLWSKFILVCKEFRWTHR